MNLVSVKWIFRGCNPLISYGNGFASIWVFCEGVGRPVLHYEHMADGAIIESVLDEGLRRETMIREAEYEAIESV